MNKLRRQHYAIRHSTTGTVKTTHTVQDNAKDAALIAFWPHFTNDTQHEYEYAALGTARAPIARDTAPFVPFPAQ